MESTSIWKVSGSTSANTGTRPARTSGATSVEKVTAAVITSLPGGKSASSTAKYSADDPELHMSPRCLPNRSATARSKALTLRPGHSAAAPPCSTSTTASISSSSCTLAA